MRSLLLDHARRYPEWEVADLYKLLHQAAMGAEHALTDEEGARRWLARELADLGPGPEEPLVDPLSPDGRIVRVHLRPFAQRQLPAEPLLRAFLQTAREVTPSPETLKLSLEQVGEFGLPFNKSALTAFFAEQETYGFQAVHHSAHFRQCYRPAYRVVARDFLPKELQTDAETTP